MKDAVDARSARDVFPAGLEQPEGSFRFSSDALLLAKFTAGQALPENAVLAELGTGCGVVSLAVLLEKPDWRSVGLEREAVLAEAAERNAAALGLGEAFLPLCGDVASRDDLRRMREALSSGTDTSGNLSGPPLFDCVMSNPPWRVESDGRTPPSDLRRRALFGTPETFREFFSAADALLKTGGLLTAVAGAERSADMLAALPKRLHPEILRFVFTKENAPAEFVLLMARKNGRGTLRVEKEWR
ncbi:MAG: methyltransferase [Mailhella sp.]|nr:methyltransferase [Mailhella sp.]